MDLIERVGKIRSRADFSAFVQVLRRNLKERPDEWENADLPSFLEALAAWTEDMDGYRQNGGEPAPEQPTWKTLGEILLAAKVYE
ncbi:MAG TPA: hypothetical protein VFW96_22430 [Thermomicrobiales bacterium]|nr:hypothetical protein [Thermomicrobiales bacterium]